MAKLLPLLKARFTDANGEPLAGGKLYSYIAGTSTPLATYTDDTEDTPNENPVVLDANGEADVWLSGAYYKFILTDADDVTIFTLDNVSAVEDVVAEAETAKLAAEAARDAAATSATAAATSETNAATSATAAAGSATTAGTHASNASAAVTSAASSASSASTSATNAATSATNALNSATAAATSATNAANSGTAAANSAASAAAADVPNLLTTKGDLVGRSSSALVRVPVGTNGQILTADSTASSGVSWQSLVAARAYNSAGTSISNATITILVCANESYDTHSAHNTSTGQFTCPTAGKYRVSGSFELSSATINSGEVIAMVFKNNSEYARLSRGPIGGASSVGCGGSAPVDCAAGDVLDFRVYHANGAARNLTANTVSNWVSFEKVGN